jgi:hypothetical protein
MNLSRFSITLLWVFVVSPSLLWSSRTGLSPDRVLLIQEIQARLNESFCCNFSVSIGKSRMMATSSSAGVIMVDQAFARSASRGCLFFAIAHEYAHVYLGHDLQIFDSSALSAAEEESPRRTAQLRQRFEKEADGIAARKARQLGFEIESIVRFILEEPDPERGAPEDQRIYSKPRDRAAYIQVVYQTSS